MQTLPFGYGPALAASFLFGLAISYNNGAYNESAIFAILIGVLVLGWRYAIAVFRDVPVGGSSSVSTAVGFAWIALVAMLFVGFNDEHLVMYAQKPWSIGRTAQQGLFLILVSYIPAMVWKREEPVWLRTTRFALAFVCVLAAGIHTLKVSPTPAIDVWTVQMKGAEIFGQGKDPYVHTEVINTAPGAHGEAVPYVYPPMQMFLSYLGYALLGDVRYTMLLAVLVGGAAMKFIAWRGGNESAPTEKRLPALLEDAPALFYWLTPKMFFVLEQAWTDPVQVMWIALGVAGYVAGRPRVSAVLFGLGIATKQTMFFLIPMVVFMLGFAWPNVIIMLVVAAAFAAPYVLVEFKLIKFSLFDFQNTLPPRFDGLTFKNWMERKLHYKFNATYAFAIAAMVCGLACFRLRNRKVSEFVAAAAFLYAVFFAFNKWAFANYYFLVVGLSALGAAASFHPRLEPAFNAKSLPEQGGQDEPAVSPALSEPPLAETST